VKLRAVQERANATGVNSTPTIVVSGPGGRKVIRGAVPFEDVEAAVKAVR